MDKYDEILLEHIYCDYRWSPIPNDTSFTINESFGQIPDIDNYVQCLKEFIENKIIPYIKDGGTYSDTIKYPGVFYGVENKFFTACNIEIIASIRDGNFSWSSSYDQDHSFFNEHGGLVSIKLSAGASSVKQLIYLLCSNFAHELTHAYNDYQAQISGKKSLHQVVNDTRYTDRLLAWHFGSNENQRIMGKMLYLLSQPEQNAIIGQLQTELLNGGKSLRSHKDAFEAIKETSAYKQYLSLYKNMEYINSDELDDMTKNSILNAYLMCMEKSGRGKDFTYEDMKKKLNYLWNKWKTKFLNNAGKVAYNVYCKTQVPLINTSD